MSPDQAIHFAKQLFWLCVLAGFIGGICWQLTVGLVYAVCEAIGAILARRSRIRAARHRAKAGNEKSPLRPASGRFEHLHGMLASQHFRAFKEVLRDADLSGDIPLLYILRPAPLGFEPPPAGTVEAPWRSSWGSKGAALRVDAGCAPRLVPSLAPRAMPCGVLPLLLPVSSTGVDQAGPIKAVDPAGRPPRSPAVHPCAPALRALKSRYSSASRAPSPVQVRFGETRRPGRYSWLARLVALLATVGALQGCAFLVEPVSWAGEGQAWRDKVKAAW